MVHLFINVINIELPAVNFFFSIISEPDDYNACGTKTDSSLRV